MKQILSLLLLATTLLAGLALAQEPPPTKEKQPPADAEKPAAPSFTATLLLVKADWSKVPAAKEIEAELREALKDAVVPQKLLDKLPASGPDILFAPEIAALYTPEHYAELMAWLKEKELIVGEEKFPAVAIDREATAAGIKRSEDLIEAAKREFAEYDKDENGNLERDEWTTLVGIATWDKNKDSELTLDEWMTAYVGVDALTRHRAAGSTRLSKDDNFMELPPPPAVRTPFTKRQIELSWTLRSQYGMERVTFTRECSVRDDVRGQPPGKPHVYDDSELTFPLPLDQIAIINGFPGNSGSSSSFRTAARNKGFQVLITVAGELAATADASAMPRLHLPDIVQTFFGRSDRPDKYVAWQPAKPKDALAPMPPPSEDAAVAKEESPKFTATLLLVKSDWSQSPHAKEIEAELLEALKDASIPKGMLDRLPASGPQILFAPEVVSLYSSEHFAEFMAWLKARELVVAEEPFEQPKSLPQADAEFRKNMMSSFFADFDKNMNQKLEKEEWQKHAAYYASADANEDEVITPEEFAAYSQAQIELQARRTLRIGKDATFIDLPLPRPVRTQPFVSRRPELTWTVSWQRFEAVSKTWNHSISRMLTVSEQARGQAKEGYAKMVDNSSMGFVLPENHVAVLNAFPSRAEEEYRDAARRKGFAAVVVLGRADDKKAAEADAQFHLPDQIEVPHVNHEVDGERRFGGIGMGGMDSRPAQAATDEAPLTKIIHLQHASATKLRTVLQQLAPDEIKLAVDERTNAVIVSGPGAQLEELEAIALRLDEPAAEDKLPAPKPAETVAELKQQYADAERQAVKLAKESPLAREKLRAAVAKSFELRQKLLQAELAEFRQRTERIEQSIRQRQKIEDQIIDRRVEDLLNPELEWDSAAARPGKRELHGLNRSRPAAGGTTGAAAQKRLMELEVKQAQLELAAVEVERDRAMASNRKSPGTISQSELARLELAVNSAQVQVEKASLRLKLAGGSETEEGPAPDTIKSSR